MKFVQRIKKASLISVVIAIVIGAAFIAFPNESMKYLALIIGAATIVMGVSAIISFIRERSSSFMCVLGVFSIVLGIVVCTQYKAIIMLMVILLGIYILTSGIFNAYAALKIIATSLVFGWFTLFLSVATSILGVVAITKASAVSAGVVQFIGVALIVYAVVDIIAYFQIRSAFKEVKQVVSDTANDVREAANEFDDAFTIANSDDIETTGTIVEENDE